MSIGLLFWILYIISFIFGFWLSWPITRPFGITFLIFVLIGLLGWAQFGAAIHK